MTLSKQKGMSKVTAHKRGEAGHIQGTLRWSWLEFGARLWQHVDINKDQ